MKNLEIRRGVQWGKGWKTLRGTLSPVFLTNCTGVITTVAALE
jgi:hypothetical protein